MKESDILFNLDLAGELLKFGTEVYGRWLTNKSYQGMEHETLRRIKAATEACFGMSTKMTGDVRPCGKDERMIWIGNHPTYETQWVTIQAMSELAEKCTGVGKSELLWNPIYLPPFLAWPAWISGKGMFVPRNDHEKAVQVIKAACQTMFKPNTGVVLLTDKHRPNTERIEADREKFSKKYPGHGIEKWNYTCFPSSTGLMQVLDSVPHVRVVDFTSCLDRPEPYGATFHIHQREIPQEKIFDPSNLLPDIPGEKPVSERERMVRGFLLKLYRWKNTKFIHERKEVR